MKPEQFIREFGVDKAREVVESASDNHNKFDIALDKTVEAYKVRPKLVDLHYLKRLVESLDIINELGGMEKLTPYFITTDKHAGYTHVLKHFSGALRWLDEYWDSIPEKAISIKRVMTAIRDHESIYGEQQ